MGLNFTTTTLINSNLDPDSGVGVVLFEAITTPIDGVEKEVVKIKRDFTFVKDNIKVVRKKVAEDAVACEATVDFGALLDTIVPEKGVNYCRLDIYMEYEGAEPFYGANPVNIRKGIPFWVEFSVKAEASAESIASAVAKVIKKDQLFLIDKNVLEVAVDGGKLKLTGNTEYLRFKTLEVSMFDAVAEYADKVAVLGDKGITLDERGKNSFGTYSQIIKDLRLPTAANYQWSHIRQVETPIVGAKYDQFIVEYCAPAVNHGVQAVGERMMSHTTHVFWVNQAVSGDFAAMFDEIEDVDVWLAEKASSKDNASSEENENTTGEDSTPLNA